MGLTENEKKDKVGAAQSVWMTCLHCTHEWQQLNRSYHRDKQTESTHVAAHAHNRTSATPIVRRTLLKDGSRCVSKQQISRIAHLHIISPRGQKLTNH